MVALTAALIVGAMVWVSRIVQKPGFLAALGDPMLVAEERSYTRHNMYCDVLIYGDSTAMTGVDPQVITARTGLSACNIAVTWPVVSLLGMMPVDDFLARNPAPKYLVVQVAPRTFYVHNDWYTVTNLGPFAMMLRQKPGWPAFTLVAEHADRALKFFWEAFHAWSVPDRHRTSEYHRIYDPKLKEYDQNGGLLTLAQPPQTSCDTAPDELPAAVDRKWVEQLREHYKSRGITLLLKAAPLPECDPQLRLYQRELAPYVDQNVQPMPIGDFVTGDRHVTAQGAEVESQRLAQLIESRQQNAR
jgi:hypothetical protein